MAHLLAFEYILASALGTGQARLGAVPLDEVINDVVVCTLPAHGCEGVEDSGFRLFEIR